MQVLYNYAMSNQKEGNSYCRSGRIIVYVYLAGAGMYIARIIESIFTGHGPYNSKVFGCVMFRALHSCSHVVMFCVNVFASNGTLLPPS